MKDFKMLIEAAVANRNALYRKIAPLNAEVRKINEAIERLKAEEAEALAQAKKDNRDEI